MSIEDTLLEIAQSVAEAQGARDIAENAAATAISASNLAQERAGDAARDAAYIRRTEIDITTALNNFRLPLTAADQVAAAAVSAGTASAQAGIATTQADASAVSADEASDSAIAAAGSAVAASGSAVDAAGSALDAAASAALLLPMTRTEAIAADALPTTFMLSGFAVPGDLGFGAPYTSEGAIPDGPMAFQNNGVWYQLVLNGAAKVGWFGAQGNGTKVGGGNNDTTAINSAIIELSAAGGGELHFDPAGIYRLTDYGWGSGVFLNVPGVSLRGHGCTLLIDTLSATKHFEITSPGLSVQQALITVDVIAGQNTVTVDNVAGFTVGGTVVYSVGRDPGDAAQSPISGFATVKAIDDGTPKKLTLDIIWDRDSSIGSSTNWFTKSVNQITEIKNIEVTNFVLDTTTAGIARESIFQAVRNATLSNVHFKAGSGLVIYNCDNIDIKNVEFENTCRCIEAAQSTNVKVDGLNARNIIVYGGPGNEAYFGNIIYAEFYAEVSMKNVFFNNSSSNVSAFVPIVCTHSCRVNIEDIHIMGYGGFTLFRDDTATERVTIRNLTLDLDRPLAGGLLGVVSGRFDYRVAGTIIQSGRVDLANSYTGIAATAGDTQLSPLVPNSIFKYTSPVLTGNATATLVTDNQAAGSGFRSRIIAPESLGGYTLLACPSFASNYNIFDVSNLTPHNDGSYDGYTVRNVIQIAILSAAKPQAVKARVGFEFFAGTSDASIVAAYLGESGASQPDFDTGQQELLFEGNTSLTGISVSSGSSIFWSDPIVFTYDPTKKLVVSARYGGTANITSHAISGVDAYYSTTNDPGATTPAAMTHVSTASWGVATVQMVPAAISMSAAAVQDYYFDGNVWNT